MNFSYIKILFLIYMLSFIFNIMISNIIDNKLNLLIKNELLIDIIENNPDMFLFDIFFKNSIPLEVFNHILKSDITLDFDEQNITLHEAIDANLSPNLLLFLIHNYPHMIMEQNKYQEYPLQNALNNNINLIVVKEILNKGRNLSSKNNYLNYYLIENQLDRNGKNLFELLMDY